jgi:L-asparaginase II
MTKPDSSLLEAPALAPPGPEPILVEVTRGPIVESRHAVDAAVVDASGALVAAWGEVERPVYPRSASKPLQALPLVESGAADAFGLQDRELALACASHSGEPVHVGTVKAWLARLGLSEADLECGAHLPRAGKPQEDFIRSGAALAAAHNNCSGKHAGMLSHAVHLGEPTAGYVGYEHPVQRRVAAAYGEMCGLDLAKAPRGTDGCSIPTFAIPLAALALGLARFANPDGQAPARQAACRRLARAMWAEPYMVAGLGRCCTAILGAAPGRIVAKTGAEGVYVAGLAGRGLGLAVKARDGAGRAAEVALLALLGHLDALDEAARTVLAPFAAPEVRNVRGLAVGRLGATGWRSWSAF